MDWRNHAIPALTPIVYDTFCLSVTSTDMVESREMILSMLLGMISCSSTFTLLIHILKFYRVSDLATWRAASSRISECILSQFEKGYKYENTKEIALVKSVLECCSSGVLLQNQRLIFEKLISAYEGFYHKLNI